MLYSIFLRAFLILARESLFPRMISIYGKTTNFRTSVFSVGIENSLVLGYDGFQIGVFMSPRYISILLPFVFACETNLTPLVENPQDLTDVQIQELINSSGMNQVDASALEEEIPCPF